VSSAFVDELQRAIEDEAAGGASWRRGFARFCRNRVSLGGAVLVAVLATMALAAPLIAKVVGHTPNELFSNELDSFSLPLGPDRHFLLGADQEGRDVLIRSLYGLRTSLFVSVVATAIATTIGVVAGLVAGYSGGWLDNLTSRVADVFLALPIVLVAISISSVCSVNATGCVGGLIHPGMTLVILILVAPSWPYLARIVRGQTISLGEQEFVATASALGASHRQVMFREILPNLWSQIIVFAALMIPTNIIFEATLSYLGVGIPPTTPSLGGILSDAANGSLFRYAWWMMVFPGTLVILTALGFFIVGEGLRDAFHSSSE
jgi:peptide/nickel transport system permease protein